MLKGFIVIFTAIISSCLFKKVFTKLQLGGIILVVIGLVLVGLSNIHSYNPKCKKTISFTIVAPSPLLGNFLVILGQFFLAGMFVYEEKILKEYEIDVFEIVGWEGIWGMLLSLAFILIFYILPGKDFGSYENPLQATLQIFNNKILLAAMLCSTIVIGPFNYFGTNLTKYSSAMHRCLIDASRMCVVWLISICCGWEFLKLQQMGGYVCVMLGNLIYYEIFSCDKPKSASEMQKNELDIAKLKDEAMGIGNLEQPKGFAYRTYMRLFKREYPCTMQNSEEKEILKDKDKDKDDITLTKH